MFAKTIIDSDAFLDMPQSSQLLYFQLAMRADDDGFVNNPRSIMRNVRCNEDDIKVLIAKKFIIPFESGVIVIKHWRIHNLVRTDRYHETKYIEEKATLYLDELGAYTQTEEKAVMLPPTSESGGKPTEVEGGLPMVNQRLTEVRLGKVSLGKVITTTTTADAPTLTRCFLYFKDNYAGDYMSEAEKFYAYNNKRNWDCLPNWEATADLWIARIGNK